MCFLSISSCSDAVSMFLWDLGHCFVKHSALRYSSIRPFTMDRLQISEKYKSIFRPSQTRLSKHTNTDESMCKGIKEQIKGGCNGASLIFVLRCQNHAKHYHEIRRKQNVQPSKPRTAFVLSTWMWSCI